MLRAACAATTTLLLAILCGLAAVPLPEPATGLAWPACAALLGVLARGRRRSR